MKLLASPTQSHKSTCIGNQNPLAPPTHDQDLTSPQRWCPWSRSQRRCPWSWWTLQSHLNVDSDLTSTSMPTSILISDDDDDARRDQRWRCKMQLVRDRWWWISDDESRSTIYKRKGIGEREQRWERREKNKLKRKEREKRIKKY